MKLTAPSGNALELVVLGYEHPHLTEDRWDSNWLVINGKVTAGGQSWRFVEPCVTTFELEALAGWLEDIREDDPDEFTFTEPDLAFFYSPGPPPVLRIRFAAGSAPPWLEPDDRAAGQTVEFPMSGDEGVRMAEGVRAMLADHPQRGGAA
jgi:hypothetical protein